MKEITNIHVDCTSHNRTKAAASWEMGGARFHFWFNTKTLEIENAVGHKDRCVYKNPPRGLTHHDEGYFNTRYLNATAHVKVIGYVFEHIKQHDLITKAVAAADAKEAERLRQAAEDARIARIKEAGPELLAALECLEKFASVRLDRKFLPYDNEGHHPLLQARAVLAKVTGAA